MDRILFIPKTDFDYYENVELVINEPENEIALEGLRCQVRGVLCDIDDGEDVVLISDMYLPKELIVKMLGKVSEKIAKLPLFLSSE